MTTTVVNIKVTNIRPKYQNLNEWINEPNNVYIGRKGVVFIDGKRFPPTDSIWCNPYKISKYSRDEAIEKYEKYITDKIKTEHLEEEFIKLKGKTLGCWCKPEKCHGDVLVKILNKIID